MYSKNTPWKEKIQNFFGICQHELKKTTLLGKKMISASRINTSLNHSYEELGKLAYQAMLKNDLTWDKAEAQELKKMIDQFELDMIQYEEELKTIKSRERQD